MVLFVCAALQVDISSGLDTLDGAVQDSEVEEAFAEMDAMISAIDFDNFM